MYWVYSLDFGHFAHCQSYTAITIPFVIWVAKYRYRHGFI